jgi:hypothetical protein
MSFLDTLVEAAEIPEAAYIKYLQQYKFEEDGVHIFLEGVDDQSFYTNYIETLLPEEQEIFYYICDGKDNVYQNYSDINWSKFNKSRTLFFTDKDFDDILNISRSIDDNIFVTKYYSIENYLVKDDVLVRFLKEVCSIRDIATIDEIVNTFKEQLNVFSELMISISAWLIYVREEGFDTNFNNIDISNLFEISNDFQIKKLVNSKYGSAYDYLCKSTSANHPFDYTRILNIARNLSNLGEPKVYLRGKYELWFMFIFCKKVIEIIVPKLNKGIKQHNRSNKTKITKCNIHIELKEQNILQITAPRVKIPKEVKEFISKNINANA